MAERVQERSAVVQDVTAPDLRPVDDGGGEGAWPRQTRDGADGRAAGRLNTRRHSPGKKN
jgi:hypothetical protein